MNVAKPLVSVVIPAYNARLWIAQSIASVLAQSYENLEVIVVDDGSTDGTGDIASRCSHRVRVVRQANRGEASARNFGIANATGDLVAFLDADDLWLPEKLERQVRALQSNGSANWVVCDALVFDEASGLSLGRVAKNGMPEGWVVEKLLRRNFIGSPVPVVRRSLLQQVGGFDQTGRFPIGVDWHMWLRLSLLSPLVCVQEPLALVRAHGASMTGAMDLSVALASRLAVIDDIATRIPKLRENVVREAQAEAHIGVAKWYLRRLNTASARRVLLRAPGWQTNVFAIALLAATFAPQSVVSTAQWLRRLLRSDSRAIVMKQAESSD